MANRGELKSDEKVLTHTELLISYFEQLLVLDEMEKRLVNELFKPRHYRKRHYILQEGDICNHLSFVVKGCLRLYKTDEEGNTHILQFATENRWVSDIGSFHGRKSSGLNIDALEDTLVLQIKYEDLLELYTEAPKFNRIFRVITENSFVALQERLLQYISSTAEERYLSFLKAYPELLKRIPQKQVAAFIGISPEFLSRLRRSLKQEKS